MKPIPKYYHHRRMRNRRGRIKIVVFYVAFKRLSLFNTTSNQPKLLSTGSNRSVYKERRDSVRYTNKRPPYLYRSKRSSMLECTRQTIRIGIKRSSWTLFNVKYNKLTRLIGGK